MGRPSNRAEKRRELAEAFERALAKHGLGGATIVAVADEAGVAPGLIHHHFRDREDLAEELVSSLVHRFRAQLGQEVEASRYLAEYVDAALSLRATSGRNAAKAWVGLFAEAVRSATVGRVMRRVLDRELRDLTSRFEERGMRRQEAEQRAAGLLSCIIGCLVLGALMPGKATGFAAPFAKRLV